MKREGEIRDELKRLGADLIARKGEFGMIPFNNGINEYELPCLYLANFNMLGHHTLLRAKNRQHVVQYGQVVLKSGVKSGIDREYRKLGWRAPELNFIEDQHAFGEFVNLDQLSDLGLPTLVPLCLVHNINLGRFYLAEARGVPLREGLDVLGAGWDHRELQATRKAVGGFHKKTMQEGRVYIPVNGNPYEQMVRFGNGSGYEVLVNGLPDFRARNSRRAEAFDNVLG